MQEAKDERELIHKINNLDERTNGKWQEFCVEHNICPICLEDLQLRGKIKGCLNCGFEPHRMPFAPAVPFGQSTIPDNQLAFGKGQGDTLGREGLFCVLAHSSGVQDLPIRTRHITVLTHTFDHPKIMTLLRLGRNLAHEWGFDIHREKRSIIFSNYYGHMLRVIGREIILKRSRLPLRKIAKACFALSLRAINGEEDYHKALDQLGLSQEGVEKLYLRYKELCEVEKVYSENEFQF